MKAGKTPKEKKPKTRVEMYNEIIAHVEELKRQDEIEREGENLKTVITTMEDLKKHIRTKYGPGVVAGIDNHLMWGSFQLINGQIVVYQGTNIQYKFETVPPEVYAERLREFKTGAPETYHKHIPLADYYRKESGETWQNLADQDRLDYVGPRKPGAPSPLEKVQVTKVASLTQSRSSDRD